MGGLLGGGGGDSIEALYSSMGMALVGTVVDGDCGIGVACQTQGLLHTAGQRAFVHQELVLNYAYIRYSSHERTHKHTRTLMS